MTNANALPMPCPDMDFPPAQMEVDMKKLLPGRVIAWAVIAAGACGIAFTISGWVAAFSALLTIGLILLWLES